MGSAGGAVGGAAGVFAETAAARADEFCLSCVLRAVSAAGSFFAASEPIDDLFEKIL